MLKVTDIVSEIIQTDETVQEALQEGLLNLSAYADKIHQKVENATKKPVKKGTIVVSLSRLTKLLPKKQLLVPNITLNSVDIKSSLTLLTYKKNVDTQRKISVLNPFLLTINDLFSITEGPEEITIVCSDRSKETIIRNLTEKPKMELNGLIALSVSFSEKNIEIPNVLYTLLSSLAAKRINILELVSTYTSLTFILRKEDMEEAIKVLNIYFGKRL